jgi:UDP-N-acetylglucosamine 2-epimerase (non-hydrolysing)
MARRRKVLVVFGTRPEAIKMAPVIARLGRSDVLAASVCVTAQHREMLDQVLSVFEIEPQRDMRLMQPDQDLCAVTANALPALREVLQEERPDVLLVQGDTTTTFAAALAAYYQRVPVAHLEAGLRTGDRFNPFPEEVNRRVVSLLADWHFAPTPLARDNLLREGAAAESVFVTGNTVVDALLMAADLTERRPWKPRPALAPLLAARRLILVTSHRRESFGAGLESICRAFVEIARRHADVEIVYPVHLNPRVRDTVERVLGAEPRVHLVEPLDYLEFVHLLRRSYLVLTDSGGVQEEAPSFGVPVLVLRATTERPEGIEAGVARLVGASTDAIVAAAGELLSNPAAYAAMARATNPYGDGHAAERVVAQLERGVSDEQ